MLDKPHPSISVSAKPVPYSKFWCRFFPVNFNLGKKNASSTHRRRSKTDSKQLPGLINTPVTFYPPPSRSDVLRREYDRQRMELQSSSGQTVDIRSRELTGSGKNASRLKKSSPKSERYGLTCKWKLINVSKQLRTYHQRRPKLTSRNSWKRLAVCDAVLSYARNHRRPKLQVWEDHLAQ